MNYSDEPAGEELRKSLLPNSFNWKMRTMLGRSVRVTLSREPLVEVTGRLLAFDEGGEVILIDDCGFRRFGWPNLECIELAKDLS